MSLLIEDRTGLWRRDALSRRLFEAEVHLMDPSFVFGSFGGGAFLGHKLDLGEDGDSEEIMEDIEI